MDGIDRDALWRQMGDCTAAAESRAPGLVTRFNPGCWMVTCDANTWSANWIAVYTDDDNTIVTFRDCLDHAEASGNNTSVVVSEAARDRVVPLFTGRPMKLDGNPPLMWRDARPLAPNPRPYGGTIREAVREEDLGAVLDMIATAFEVDPDESRKANFGMLDSPAMRMYTATSDALDSACITHSVGPTTYIFILATTADRQRHGAGRALMTRAMDESSTAGAGQFYLMSSTAGQPLYRALGFETYELPEFWEIHPLDHK